MTEVTAIVARDFRGATLFLKDYSMTTSEFQWTDDRSKAWKFVPAVAVAVAEKAAREWKADAYAIDSQGSILRPANSRPGSEPASIAAKPPAKSKAPLGQYVRADDGTDDYVPASEDDISPEGDEARAERAARARGEGPQS